MTRKLAPRSTPQERLKQKLTRWKDGYYKPAFSDEVIPCKVCRLLFPPEEHHLIDPTTKVCVRCSTERQHSPSEYPSCYSQSYHGADPCCTDLCALGDACRIATSDIHSEELVRDPEAISPHVATVPLTTIVMRILRATNRSLASRDLAILIEKFTDGRYVALIERKDSLTSRLAIHCTRSQHLYWDRGIVSWIGHLYDAEGDDSGTE